MANINYQKDGKTFLKCKECGEFKEIIKENWYYHKDGFLGVLGRCKDCILKGRKTDHEIMMARKRDKDRYMNNSKRREYIFKSSAERRKRKGYTNVHNKVDKFLTRNMMLRPKECSICGIKGTRIIAHHPDYSKWNEIVFCCQPCHDKIHKGKIECPQPINLLELIKSK